MKTRPAPVRAGFSFAGLFFQSLSGRFLKPVFLTVCYLLSDYFLTVSWLFHGCFLTVSCLLADYFNSLKRVEYLQISDYRLFKKIQLAFNHVRTPLKSELNFGKLLITNDLAKSDSLQSLSASFPPHSQPYHSGIADNQ